MAGVVNLVTMVLSASAVIADGTMPTVALTTHDAVQPFAEKFDILRVTVASFYPVI